MRQSLIIFILLLSSSLLAKPSVPITRVDSPFHIDGVLEPAWQDIDPLPEPIEFVPNEGDPPSQRTLARIAYDDDWFYIIFEAWCDPDELKITVCPRSGWGSDDQVVFALDTCNANREAYLFNFNAQGNPKDWITSTSGASDMNWDIPLKSVGRVYEDKFIVEAAIPIRSLSFDDSQDEQRWGFYYFRKDEQFNEQCVWPQRSQSIGNLLTQSGVLTGMRGVKSGHRIDVVPYAFGGAIRDIEGDWDTDGDIGVDVEAAVTSQVQVSGTLNPDYSQIEADAFNIDVNRRDPLYLSEKRPFFTRGADFFHTEMLNLYYSRHIENPIVGAKLSGKFVNSSLGYISALDEGLDGDRNDFYNIFRYRRNILSESTIGVMGTSVDDLDGGAWNRVGALDFMLRLPPHIVAKVQAAGTADRSETADETQKGWGMRGDFSYGDGDTWVDAWCNVYSENYRPGCGYISPRYYDTMNMGTSSRFDLWENSGPFSTVSIYGGANSTSDIGLELQERDYWIGLDFEWLNRLDTELEVTLNHNSHNWYDAEADIVQERMFSTSECKLRTSRYFNSAFDGWINFSVGNDPYYGDNGADPGFEGWQASADWGCNWRPLDRVSFSTSGAYGQFYLAYEGDHKYDWGSCYAKMTLQLRRNLHFRTVMQGRKVWMDFPRYPEEESYVYTNALLNLLLTWEYRPLSNIYAGCNVPDFDRWDELDDNLQLFAKINYLWSM